MDSWMKMIINKMKKGLINMINYHQKNWKNE